MGNPLGVGGGVNIYPKINIPRPIAQMQPMLPAHDKAQETPNNTVFNPVFNPSIQPMAVKMMQHTQKAMAPIVNNIFSPNIQPSSLNIQQIKEQPSFVALLEKIQPSKQERQAVSNGDINATFAPNITIQGNADEKKLRQVLDDEMTKFKRILEELKSQQRRVSYA